MAALAFTGFDVLPNYACRLLARVAAHLHDVANHDAFFTFIKAQVAELDKGLLYPLIALIFGRIGVKTTDLASG